MVDFSKLFVVSFVVSESSKPWNTGYRRFRIYHFVKSSPKWYGTIMMNWEFEHPTIYCLYASHKRFVVFPPSIEDFGDTPCGRAVKRRDRIIPVIFALAFQKSVVV